MSAPSGFSTLRPATEPASSFIPITRITSAFVRKRIALVVLLVGEILYLTVSFDTEGLETVGSLWTMVAGWSSEYLRVASASVFVLLLLVATRFITPRSTLSVGTEPVSRGWMAFHLTAFAVFVWLTGRFFANETSVATHPGAWTATWLLVGTAMVGSWALAMYPLARWRTAIFENRAWIAWSVAAGVTVWTSRFIAEAVWVPLARQTFAVVTWLLHLIYSDTVSQPERLIVGTPQFKVTISPECSGYEGIGLILGFLSIYLLLFRKELRLPGALLLLPIGAAVIWLLNAARIVALIAIGTSGWPAVAIGGFHSQAGWLTFNAVALGFVALINRAGYFSAGDAPSDRKASDDRRGAVTAAADSTAAYLGPFVALLGTAMVTGALSAGFDWLYGVRIATALTVLWACRATYRDLDWRCSWEAFAIGVTTFVMWILMFPTTLDNETAWPLALQSVSSYTAGAWLGVRLLGYVLVVPVVEELAFRVYALRRVLHREIDAVPVGTFSFLSFAISSILFGALHGALWLQGTLAGMAFACALYRRRRFGDAVLAHATTNGLIALYVFVTGRWSVWS